MGKKATHDLAPLVRTAFVNAMGILESEGKTFSQMMKECIEEQGLLAVLDRMSKFNVREQHVSGSISHKHQHTHEDVSETAQFIAAAIGTSNERETKKPH